MSSCGRKARAFGSFKLDDLTVDRLPPFAPALFLILQTSPGSFQAWASMPGRHEKEFARRVRIGAGTDRSASGATRIAGSLNIKHKYARIFSALRSARRIPGG
jgi:hypothetical protein